MRLHYFCFYFFAVVLFSLPGAAQNAGDYQLSLINGSFTPGKNIFPGSKAGLNLRLGPVQVKSFVVIQFETIPDEEAKAQLKAEGIELLDYIPNYAYTATVNGALNVTSLTKNKARAVIELTAAQKMQPALTGNVLPAHAIKKAGMIDVWVSYPRSFTFEEISTELKNYDLEMISDLHKSYQVVSLRVAISRLKELAMLPFIQYVQAVPQEDKPFNQRSTINSRANYLRSSLPGHANLQGEGVVVGIGDNANPLQHIDYSNRVINRTAIDSGAHGVHTMGSIVGGGIINERYTGYAPKATILAQNYSNIISFAAAYVKDFGMVVTNNSYGGDVNSCDTYGAYDMISNILDQQAFQLPYLQHVFAAGNSGASTCSPFPASFGTMLSGYQSAKNVISVGNTNNAGVISGTSSTGPVKDGRIKPEIVAQGIGVASTGQFNVYEVRTGTSMAAPAVSGGLVLLYQKYRQLHQNKDPKNGLMKALICNGGIDKGNAGPDYKYGFGWMNLLRSLTMMESNAYINDSLTNQATKIYSINVPANTAQLKVMLYWNDPATTILSGKMLVNNLDLRVASPNSTITLPKLLDPTPSNVSNPATTGVDNINNIEQVVIDKPVEGTYTISIKGSSIVQNPRQEFFVVYDAIPVSTTLTYPIGKENLKDGEPLHISWDSFGNESSTFTVQFSQDNGANWQGIGADNLSADSRLFIWTVPVGTITDKAKIKVIQNETGRESVSQAFTILGVPVISLSPTQCEGYIALNWTEVAGATDYEVMILKGNEMVSVATTVSLNYTIPDLSADSTYWVSVRARLNGNEGRRGLAVSRKPNSGDCAGPISDNDLKIESILSPVTSGRKNTSTEFTSNTILKIRIKNLDNTVSAGTFTVGGSVNGSAISEQSVTPQIAAGGAVDVVLGTFDFSAINNYEVKVFLNKEDDPVKGNNTLTKTFRHLDNPVVSLPFSDDLESLPEQTFSSNQIGLTGGNRYDFATDSDAGRIRTFVNSGLASSGNRAITLDANRFYPAGTSSFFLSTFNLSSYHVAADDIRLTFEYKNHGQKNNVDNKVWIRGRDTDTWIVAYDLYANQNFPEEGYKVSASLEISKLLTANGKEFSSSFQIRWGQWGETITADEISGAGYTIDNISLFKIASDLQAVSVGYPLLQNCGLGTAEPISVIVKNLSTGSVSGIPVTYKLSNGIKVTETISTLASGKSVNYIFTTKADLSALGAQSVSVYVDHGGDNYRSNDTIKVDYYNSPVISTFPYLQNFESGDGYWFAGGKNSSWQYGTPSAAAIKTAASGRYGWKTNLSGSYNDKEESYLYSPCFTVSGMTAPTLSFSTALDLELCESQACDIAYMEYSGNGGAWTRLGATTRGTNWYNKTYDNLGSWSVQDYTRWHVATIPLPTGFTTLKLRFVLKSDSFTRREGIAVDDIHIYNRVNGIYDETSMTTPVSQSVAGGTNWVNFTRNGKLVASINPNNQNIGATDVQAYIHTGSVRNTNNQFYLNRNITIKSANPVFTTPVTIRIYFLETEAESLISAVGCANCSTASSAFDLGVFKYSNTDKVLEDGNFANNTGGDWLFYQAADVVKVPFDKGYYAELKVKDFSEFWLSKNVLMSSSALPVELISFNAKKVSQESLSTDVMLEWVTSAEKDFDHFETEVAIGNEAYRSGNFVKLGETKGKGNGAINQQYSFTDIEAGKYGTRYYRLKMLDLDGTYAYSRVRSVVFEDKNDWNVYPNPSIGIFNIAFKSVLNQEVTVDVYDLNGRLYFKNKISATGAMQKLKVDLSGAGFSSGLYLVEVRSGERKQSFRLIKD